MGRLPDQKSDLIKIDENKFIDMLLNAGVSRSDIKIMPLSSVATSPDMVAKWFRKSFNTKIY